MQDWPVGQLPPYRPTIQEKYADDLKCPITHGPLKDPYTTDSGSGHSFERAELEAYMQHTRNNRRGLLDPLTRAPFTKIVPNRALKALLDRETRPVTIVEADTKIKEYARMYLADADKYERLGQLYQAEMHYKWALEHSNSLKKFRRYVSCLAAHAPTIKLIYALLDLVTRYDSIKADFEAKNTCEDILELIKKLPNGTDININVITDYLKNITKHIKPKDLFIIKASINNCDNDQMPICISVCICIVFVTAWLIFFISLINTAWVIFVSRYPNTYQFEVDGLNVTVLLKL